MTLTLSLSSWFNSFLRCNQFPGCSWQGSIPPSHYSGMEKQPKHKVFGQDIPRMSGRISGRTSRPKSAGPKRGCLNVGAWNPQESGRKAPLSCNAAFSMLQCSFSFAAVQLLVQMTTALQKSQCCSAVSAAQHSENCSATSVFACGMLQGWGLEGSGLGPADQKLSVTSSLGAQEKKFFVRKSLTQGADVHDPRGSQQTFCRKTLGCFYRFLIALTQCILMELLS